MPRGSLQFQCIVGTASTALSNVATRLPRVGLGSGLAEPHRRTFAPASCLRWSATLALGARPSPHGFLRRNIQLKNEGKAWYHLTATGPIPQTIRRCAFRVQAGAQKLCGPRGISVRLSAVQKILCAGMVSRIFEKTQGKPLFSYLRKAGERGWRRCFAVFGTPLAMLARRK
jgi:hypothetical protein